MGTQFDQEYERQVERLQATGLPSERARELVDAQVERVKRGVFIQEEPGQPRRVATFDEETGRLEYLMHSPEVDLDAHLEHEQIFVLRRLLKNSESS